MFGRDYTPLGLFGAVGVLGGAVLLPQTSGAIATVLSALVIAAGLVMCVVFFRLQTRPMERKGRCGPVPEPSQADGRCGARTDCPAGRFQ
jgi:hypothetical protein